jgi:hypothetical protein
MRFHSGHMRAAIQDDDDVDFESLGSNPMKENAVRLPGASGTDNLGAQKNGAQILALEN